MHDEWVGLASLIRDVTLFIAGHEEIGVDTVLLIIVLLFFRMYMRKDQRVDDLIKSLLTRSNDNEDKQR